MVDSTVNMVTQFGDKVESMILLAEAMNLSAKSKGSLNFRGWTLDMFTRFCIVSGCDYLENVPGIGIVAAHEIVWAHRNRKTRADLERAIVNQIAYKGSSGSGSRDAARHLDGM